MNYAEAVAFLESRINYEVVGLPDADDLRLGRMVSLLAKLGDPHRKYRVVHVAGTKGKGSTATMIAALLCAAGAKVGLHLSPHFDRIEERMRVDGVEPAADEFASIVEAIATASRPLDRARSAGEPGLTFFEVTTAAAFEHFARIRVDWAVIEVGVGGRLDATNVVDPAVAVIAEIGLDHTKTLGSTVKEIAAEKAGIIKPRRPVAASATHPDAIEVIEQFAARNDSPLKRYGKDFRAHFEARGLDGGRVAVETWKARREFDWRLLGAHQARNAALAWGAIDLIADEFGLASVPSASLSGVQIPGRLEVLQREPFTLLLDVAHNEPSAAALADFLQSISRNAGKRVLVFAATRDKNWPAMLERLVPQFDIVVCTQYRQSPRATPVALVEEWLRTREVPTVVTKEPSEAWLAACSLLQKHEKGLICLTGSFFLIAEIRPFLLQKAAEGPIK